MRQAVGQAQPGMGPAGPERTGGPPQPLPSTTGAPRGRGSSDSQQVEGRSTSPSLEPLRPSRAGREPRLRGRGTPTPGALLSQHHGLMDSGGARIQGPAEHPQPPPGSGLTFAARVRKAGRKGSRRVCRPLRLAPLGALHAQGLRTMTRESWGTQHLENPAVKAEVLSGPPHLAVCQGRGREQAAATVTALVPPRRPQGRAGPKVACRPVPSSCSAWMLGPPSRSLRGLPVPAPVIFLKGTCQLRPRSTALGASTEVRGWGGLLSLECHP